MKMNGKSILTMALCGAILAGNVTTCYASGWNIDPKTREYIYENNDGSLVRNDWRKSGDFWFYLGADGQMVRDSFLTDDGNYYVDFLGVMMTEQWILIDITTRKYASPLYKDENGVWHNKQTSETEKWFYLGADGKALQNCWYQDQNSGLWYYLGSDGIMLANTTTPDGYYVNADGVWIP